MSIDTTKLSRTMAHALRHAPAEYGLELDADGWTKIEALLAGLRKRKSWRGVTRDHIERVVAKQGEKKRYQIEGERIRALHGHSVAQKIQHIPSQPPPILYHGTPESALKAIQREGLQPMQRQYVHFSTSSEQAIRVGARGGGKTLLLVVDAARAHAEGIKFYRTSESVWLCDHLPPQYIEVDEQ